jgi:hypothetical protein
MRANLLLFHLRLPQYGGDHQIAATSVGLTRWRIGNMGLTNVALPHIDVQGIGNPLKTAKNQMPRWNLLCRNTLRKCHLKGLTPARRSRAKRG